MKSWEERLATVTREVKILEAQGLRFQNILELAKEVVKGNARPSARSLEDLEDAIEKFEKDFEKL